MKKIVLRTCALTRERLEKKDLFRIVREPDGKVSIDDTYKINGKGCYLKKDKEVIEKALKNKVIDRNLNIKIPECLYEELLKKI